MAKLEIDFHEATDDEWEYFLFRQAGHLGYKLPGCWLPEFVEALEAPDRLERYVMYNTFGVVKHKGTATVSCSSKKAPLLQLDAGQCAKLVVHLKTTYAALL